LRVTLVKSDSGTLRYFANVCGVRIAFPALSFGFQLLSFGHQADAAAVTELRLDEEQPKRLVVRERE